MTFPRQGHGDPPPLGRSAVAAGPLKTVRLKTVRLKAVRLKAVRLKTVRRSSSCTQPVMSVLLIAL